MPPQLFNSISLWNVLVSQHEMRGHNWFSYLFAIAILFPSHSQRLRQQNFFPYLWVCSWSNRGQKIQHCEHSTRVDNDRIRALYGCGSCLEFHISYVFLRANRRRWNRMICVPAGQNTSHSYNTHLLWALHFSNSCKLELAYRHYSPLLSLPSVRQTKNFPLLKPVGHVSPKTTCKGLNFSIMRELRSLFPTCYTVWRT